MYCRHFVSSRVNTKNRSTPIRSRAEFRGCLFHISTAHTRGRAKSPGLVSGPWKCMHVAVFTGLERDVIDHRIVKIRPETPTKFSDSFHVSPTGKQASCSSAIDYYYRACMESIWIITFAREEINRIMLNFVLRYSSKLV